MTIWAQPFSTGCHVRTSTFSGCHLWCKVWLRGLSVAAHFAYLSIVKSRNIAEWKMLLVRVLASLLPIFGIMCSFGFKLCWLEVMRQTLIQTYMVIQVSQRPLWCHPKLLCQLIKRTRPLLHQKRMNELIVWITKLTNLNLVELQLCHLIFKSRNSQNSTFVK